MTSLEWNAVTPITWKIQAQPEGLWTPVLEFVEGPVKLKIMASGTWEYLPGAPCGPDGHIAGGVMDDALVASNPIGSLVAKIGGGTCDKPDAGKVSVFGVGTFCVISIAQENSGPLFLAMNDRVPSVGRHSGELTISIFEAR